MSRLASASPLISVLLAVTLTACGEDGGLRFEGEPGKPVPLTLSAWVPIVEGAVGGLMVDTGAPLTMLDKAAHPSLPSGQTTVRLQAFGLTFLDLPVVVAEIFSTTNPCEELPGGLVGGDLLRAFTLGLDYKGKRAFLFSHESAANPAQIGDDTEAATPVEVEVRGGGVAILPKISSPISVPATRVMVVDASVEGTQVHAMVDTGASITVISKELMDGLQGAGRPSLCCESVVTLYGSKKLSLSRVRELKLGQVTVSNQPVLVMDDQEFFAALSSETGREIKILVGGSFLRHFAVGLDYAGHQLRLGRYREQSHIDPNEFVGPGFSFCKAKKAEDGMVVMDVYQGTDAEQQGIKERAMLMHVDGQSVLSLSAEEVHELIAQKLGKTVRLSFKATPQDLQVDLVVQKMLPGYN